MKDYWKVQQRQIHMEHQSIRKYLQNRGICIIYCEGKKIKCIDRNFKVSKDMKIA